MNRSMKLFFKLFLVHFFVLTFSSFLFRGYILQTLPKYDFMSYLYAIVVGACFDFTVSVYSFFPYVILIILFSSKIKKIFPALIFTDVFIAFFTLSSEYLFFQEFKDRFNFIAVDYLVYSNEVLRNIWESYPLVSIILGIILLSLFFCWYLVRVINLEVFSVAISDKIKLASLYVMVASILVFIVNERLILDRANAYEAILSKNAYHAFFAAYRNNEIEYDKFYTTMDENEAAHFVHEAFEDPKDETNEDSQSSVLEDESSIARNILDSEVPLRLNVIVVLMESLSAKYMGIYNNSEGLTPNLDRLSSEGLFFNKLYSTGTRTVRGIEAVVLSIPPTPGQSIVRRPGGQNLFNIGSVFESLGYENKFIYGGNSFFDNMGTFFSGNSFKVIDQSTFNNEEVAFSNAWGVSDEDLFRKVIHESDLSSTGKKPFFNFVLTTSNHRPYTYPQKIDIPSGSGRSGAVKYSDFAIGEFIKAAKMKPWFNDTLFVFVSDHNASVAGGESIQPEDYHIPLILYSPAHIKPATISKLASQIDVAPTVLGILNISYQSKFFGEDLTIINPSRAFLGTYQKVGMLEEDKMTILSPNKKIEEFAKVADHWKLIETRKMKTVNLDSSAQIKKTVAYYKTASDWFTQGLLEERYRIATNKNLRRVKNGN